MAKNDTPKTDGGEVIHPSGDDDNQKFPPLVASYNDKIRPILDAVDKLRRINVTQEGIPLPTIVFKINERLHASVLDFNKLPRNLTSVSKAMGAFVQIVGSFKETLQNILIRGELEEYEDDKQMQCNARLAEMILEEANGIRLPHFLPHLVLSSLLKRRVNGVSDLPVCFVNKVCGYLEIVCVRALMDCCRSYLQLLPSMKKATQNVMGRMKIKFMERVDEMIEMEKMTDYTCDPEFIHTYDKLMGNHDLFLNSLNCLYSSSQTLNMEGYSINVKHLNDVSENIRNLAFDLKMRMTTYWKIVLKRMVDYLALQLRFFMQQPVNKEIEVEVVNEVIVNGGGIEKMLAEPPSVAKKRERLQSSISLLKESTEIIEQVMDGIVIPQFFTPYNPATLAETNTKNATMAENGIQKTEVIHPSADDHDQKFTPLVASYNDKIRPILDAVDKLRRLNVTQEGIPLPTIVVKINERLHASVLDFNKLPRNLTSVSEAMGAFVQIVGSFKETLQKIFIRGELDEYEDDKQMHCNARLAEMLDKLSQDLQSSVNFSENFLVEEMQILEEANGIRLPHFFPHLVFSSLLKRRVNSVSDLPVCFVNKVCGYLEIVCVRVLMDCCGSYPQLLPSMKKATQNVMGRMKIKFMERVDEMIEMEKMTDYTCDPEFIPSYNKLMGNRDLFLNSLNCLYNSSQTLNMEGYSIYVKHLNDVSENIRNQAFDLKMRMTAYWKIVLKRMVDYLALQLRFFMQQVVNKEIEAQVVNEVMVNGGGIEKMLAEPPSVAKKRERLQSSISLLKESKEIIEQVMDGIVVTSD
ncbi:hypothetical protein E3N88_41780 [Mikania micrantha]|uniref:GED domain-containing protein n=1 Tax=Mikania micrantha TaxID=192012 RepID=A0A5N6LKG2_9ASTR|nr:hypothetical protein E3N88_41780 [Mikania micrantha]